MYSSGFKQIREQWITPPGTDSKLVRDTLPQEDEVISHFENIKISKAPLIELATERSGEESKELFEVPLQPVSRLDYKIIATESGNTEVDSHLKSMIRSMKDKNFQGSFNKGLLRVAYTLPDGDPINMVYDLRKHASNKEDGIRATSFFQTNTQGENLDLLSILPEASVFYTKSHWLSAILRPSMLRAGMSVSDNKVHLLQGFFTRPEYSKTMTPIGMFTHESAHQWYAQKYPEKLGSASDLIKMQMGMRSIDLGSILLSLGINAWYMLPSLIANIGSYILSRKPNTKIGKNFHDLLANESHSSYIQALMSDHLRRKGFNTDEWSKDLDTVRAKFVSNYILAYQPLPWALIDMLRAIGMNIAGYTPEPKRSNQVA